MMASNGTDVAALTIVILALLAITFYILFSRYRRAKISNFGNRYVLVTGCDSGFGLLTAKRLHDDGFQVFAACLTENGVKHLQAHCSQRLVAIKMDVTDEKAIEQAREIVHSSLPKHTGLWAVLNNAGLVGPVGMCDMLTKAHYMQTMKVNLLGLISVTNAFLPLVRLSKGRVINTASTVGRFAFSSAPYSVSKFCVEGFTDCLRRELQFTGVTVHTIEPGGYRTNITDADLIAISFEKVFGQLSQEQQEFYGESYKEKALKMSRLACSLFSTASINEVVDAYVHAISAKHPKTRYTVGWNGNLFFRPLWSAPTWLSDFLMGSAYPLPQGLQK